MRMLRLPALLSLAPDIAVSGKLRRRRETINQMGLAIFHPE
jgi:hypothetical protein